MPITSVTYNEQRTGSQRRLVLGHLHDGWRVLAIDSSENGVAVLQDGGTILQIPSGSVVQVTESGMGDSPIPRAASAQKKLKPAAPTDPRGPVQAVVFHEGLGVRTLRVGNTVTDSSGRPRQVAKFIMGDPWAVIGLDNSLLLEIPIGSVVRWA